ncbi:Fungal specific transcription factor domain [Ceratobasidium sp. AG-Ba]|nr:Fungal specific transcription factor domain [Ceratobasidium sp. AG-Ba]
MLDDVFDGIQPGEPSFAMFRRWIQEYEDMVVGSSDRLASNEVHSQLSGTLEVKLLALRTTNSMDSIHFVSTYAPIFLELVRSNPDLCPSHDSASIPLARVLTSGRYELGHFILLDLVCPMAYGVPPVLDYDTSLPPSESNARLHDWINGCPLEMKLILANINKHVAWARVLPSPDWRPLEQQLLSWQPRLHSVAQEESWKRIARLAVQESWRQALLIYLYMAVCGVASNDPRVASSVRQVFQVVDTVKPRLQTVTSGQFLMQQFIAGICTPHEKQRAQVRSKLSNVIETMIWLFPVSKFVPVLDHLWHGAAAEGRPILWRDYVDSRKAVIP